MSFNNNQNYRQYMIHNANKLHKANEQYFEGFNTPYEVNNDPNHIMNNRAVVNPNFLIKDKNHPHLYTSNTQIKNPYGYETSDMKEVYLEKIKSKMVHRKMMKF